MKDRITQQADHIDFIIIIPLTHCGFNIILPASFFSHKINRKLSPKENNGSAQV